jgi:hypothetical protein
MNLIVNIDYWGLRVNGSGRAELQWLRLMLEQRLVVRGGKPEIDGLRMQGRALKGGGKQSGGTADQRESLGHKFSLSQPRYSGYGSN